MAATPMDASAGLAQVGLRLRAARQARDWSLEHLAGLVPMSASTLSRLECGKRKASLELLLPLTRVLGIRIDDLLSQEVPDPRVRRPVIRRDGMLIAPLAPVGSPLETYKITFPPVGKPPRLRVHDGYEWFYVLSGRLRLILDERETVLARGEAAEFDTRTPHSISAVGPRPAQVISIFNQSGVRMHTYSQEE